MSTINTYKLTQEEIDKKFKNVKPVSKEELRAVFGYFGEKNRTNNGNYAKFLKRNSK